VEKLGTMCNGEWKEEDFSSSVGSGGSGSDDDNVRSICTIVPHELERVKGEDEEQMGRQQQQQAGG
jgi:hypothetical protein